MHTHANMLKLLHHKSSNQTEWKVPVLVSIVVLVAIRIKCDDIEICSLNLLVCKSYFLRLSQSKEPLLGLKTS